MMMMGIKLFICLFLLFGLSNAMTIDEVKDLPQEEDYLSSQEDYLPQLDEDIPLQEEGDIPLQEEEGESVNDEATTIKACPCRRKINKDLVKSLRRCSLVIDEGLTGGCGNKMVVFQDIVNIQAKSKSCLCDKEVTVIIESALKCCNDALDQVIRICNKGRPNLVKEEMVVGDDDEIESEERGEESIDDDILNEEEEDMLKQDGEDTSNHDDDMTSQLDPQEEEVHLEGYNGKLPSCAAIKNKYSNARSGLYFITPKGGKRVRVYCEMKRLCGTGGGWTRVAIRNVKKDGCPAGFVTYKVGNVVACGKPIPNKGVCSTKSAYYRYACQSLKLPSHGVSYSQVCGKVIGYQYGATYAFYSVAAYGQNRYKINRAYVDGIVITAGSSRKHIWTYAAGYSEKYRGSIGCNCPNNPYAAYIKFVGHNYYCESGTAAYRGAKLYHKDPLWDGKQCNYKEKPCCVRRPVNMPWFKRLLTFHSTDYLELRVCGNVRITADTPFSEYEFYVK